MLPWCFEFQGAEKELTYLGGGRDLKAGCISNWIREGEAKIKLAHTDRAMLGSPGYSVGQIAIQNTGSVY